MFWWSFWSRTQCWIDICYCHFFLSIRRNLCISFLCPLWYCFQSHNSIPRSIPFNLNLSDLFFVSVPMPQIHAQLPKKMPLSMELVLLWVSQWGDSWCLCLCDIRVLSLGMSALQIISHISFHASFLINNLWSYAWRTNMSYSPDTSQQTGSALNYHSYLNYLLQ